MRISSSAPGRSWFRFGRPRRSHFARSAGVLASLLASLLGNAVDCPLGPGAVAAQERIQRLDGAEFTGQVTAIAADGTIRLATAPVPAATPIDLKLDQLDDLLLIRFAPPPLAAATSIPTATPPKPAASIHVELRDGSRLKVGAARLKDERLSLIGGLFRQGLAVSIDAVARIEWAAADAVPTPTDVLWRPSTDQDRLLVRDGDTFRAVAGIVEQVDSEQVVMDVDGEQRMIALARVAALVFAAPQQPSVQQPSVQQPSVQQPAPQQPASPQLATRQPSPPPGVRELRLADGSRWRVAHVTLDERGWRATPAASVPGLVAGGTTAGGTTAGTGEASTVGAGASAELPREAVVELISHSPRLRWLSELPPAEVAQRTWVAWPLPWGRDRAVSGGALRMRGQVFERGVGVQAGTTLSYVLPASASWFVATVGLDDAARQRGDCEIVVYGEGAETAPASGKNGKATAAKSDFAQREPLARWRIRGGERPRELLVPLAGHKRLSLVVEPGFGLDVGDHVDWGAARLILARTAP